MAQKPQNVKGMLDHLPPSALLRQHIVTTLIGVFERHGFEPMSTPAVEYAETLDGKLGDDEKLIYRVEHSGGGDRRMALRYDQTVPLARVVAQYSGEITLPFRRYAVGQSYRGENVQKGRYRELTQADIDIVGSASPLADAEAIAVIGESLTALGLHGFRTLLNHRDVLSGLARAAGVADAAAGQVYRAIDKLDKVGPERVAEELVRAGIEAAAAEQIVSAALLEGTPEAVLAALDDRLRGDSAAAAALANLRAVIAALQASGVPEASYAVAPGLARGLAYYTGVVFETVIEQPKIGSLLGGGRYDELVGQFAGRRIPTVGLAMGIERLAFVMGELGLGTPRRTTSQLLLTLPDAASIPAVLSLASSLREAGVNAETWLDADVPLGKQFQYADQKGIPLALTVRGEQLQLRVIATREDRQVPLADAVAEARRVLALA